MSRKLTNEDIDKKLLGLKIPIKRIGSITNGDNKTNIEWECLLEECKYKWFANFNNISKTKNPTGCYACGRKNRAQSNKITHEEFLKRTLEIHGDEFEYLEKCDGIDKNILIKHKKCQTEFYQRCADHVSSSFPQGCPFCRSPKGEKLINRWLSQHNIIFKHGISFQDCKNPKTNYRLRFDFCVYDNIGNIICLIEYQGSQHYIPTKYLGRKVFSEEQASKRLKEQKFRDKIKHDYCKNKNIKLIKIKYTKLNNLEEYLSKFLTKHFIFLS